MKDERCRVCLGNFSYSTDLFIGDDPIYRRVEMITDVKVVLSKNLPSKICETCLNELNMAIKFKKKFEISDKILQKTLELEENNIQLEEVECISKKTSIQIENDQTECKENKVHGLNVKESAIECELVENTKKPQISRKQKIKTKRLKINDQSHISSENQSKICNEEKLNCKKNRKHMCAICGKKFLLNGNLIAHERIHSGDKPFRCKVCNQSFSQSGHLMIHERTHSGIKPYQCEQCSKCFTVSQSLKKHLRTHTGEKPYPCTICNKSFGTSYHRSAHIKTHSGKKKYECYRLGCRTGFSTAQEMNTHKFLHTN